MDPSQIHGLAGPAMVVRGGELSASWRLLPKLQHHDGVEGDGLAPQPVRVVPTPVCHFFALRVHEQLQAP